MSAPNADNAATRLIALFVISLLICAAISIYAGFALMANSGRTNTPGVYIDYSTGTGLCFLAAAIALASGLFAMVKLLKE